VLVKDNYDVAGLQTTGGSAALLGWISEIDATVIARIRAAGGIIMAKTTMSEWARGGLDNINKSKGTEDPTTHPPSDSHRLAATALSANGTVSLTCVSKTSPTPDARSRGRDRISPLVRRVGAEYSQRRAGDEMALEVEGIVDGGVHAEKTLRGASRLEPLRSSIRFRAANWPGAIAGFDDR
jgi:hypothetical protein